MNDTFHPNTGHGHVHPRADGVKARCGGPSICPDCARAAAKLGLVGKLAQEPAAAAAPAVAIPREILSFLLGEGDLDGVSFGERPAHARGNFWWRNNLRAAMDAAPAVAVNAEAPLRGSGIAKTLRHGAGAYAQCGYCGRYSDNPQSLSRDSFPCDCGKLHGWSGSFKKPTTESKWSGAAPPAESAQSPKQTADEMAALIVRDVCELEADPGLPDTACVNVGDLLTIVKRHISAAQPAQPIAPAGWRFNVSFSDGRAWLEIQTPHGATAAPSARATIDSGSETVAAQVLRYLGDTLAAQPAQQSEPAHSDDAAVDAFSAAMKQKLAQARENGRNGWQECDPAALSCMLREHVEKGDPRDVANFCMFLWSLQQPIAAEPGLREWLNAKRNPAAPQAAQAAPVDAPPPSKDRIDLCHIIHDMVVAQQAAWIEWQHGEGAEAGMRWIHNGLCGPGNIPDEDAPYGKEPQAYFDANKFDPFPTCKCGRPSNTLWMGQGFCGDEHYREAKALAAIEQGDAA